MEKNTKKKIPPILVAVLVVLYIGPLVGVAAYAAGMVGAGGFAGVGAFLILYALLGGAVIVGIISAAAQRLREIDGGEEDEAKKY